MRLFIIALLFAISYAQTVSHNDTLASYFERITAELIEPINATEEVFYVAEDSSKRSTFKKPLTWVILVLATIFGAIAATYCLKYINSRVKKIPSADCPQMSHLSSTRSESLTSERNKSATHRESVRRRYNDDGNFGSRKSIRESVFDPSRKSGMFSGSASSRRSARFKAPCEERSRSRYGGGRHFIPMEKSSSNQNVLESPKKQPLTLKNNNQPLLYE